MNGKIVWGAALLLSTAAAAQTPAPTPTAPPPTSTATVPEATPSSPMSAGTAAKVSAADRKFVEKAASGGMAEVQAAQLAQQKSQDPKVKDFAQQMITDHTAANQQLTTIAQQKGLTIPASLDAKDQKEIDKLQSLSGTKFDRVYMKSQARDHEAMLKLLQREASSGKDPDLKSFADQTAPTVQKHIDMIKTDTPG
jgi:putative membrane protein